MINHIWRPYWLTTVCLPDSGWLSISDFYAKLATRTGNTTCFCNGTDVVSLVGIGLVYFRASG